MTSQRRKSYIVRHNVSVVFINVVARVLSPDGEEFLEESAFLSPPMT